MRTDGARMRSAAAFCFSSSLVGLLALGAFGGCGTKTGNGTGFAMDPTGGGSSGGSSEASTEDGSSSGALGDDGGGGLGQFTLPDGEAPDRAAPAGNCKLPGLWCYQTSTCTTELTGTVFDPAGLVPLSNVVVYVPADPSKPLTPIKTGTNSCSACSTQISNYMALAVTDVDGHFTMKGVPATSAVPVVVQIGKWRREITLSSVTACKAAGSTYVNHVNDGVLRLPRSKKEGDIPQMAVATGGADDLGCFLKEMGLDPSEYSAPNAGGRLDVYQGVGGPGLTTGTAGACTGASPVCPLWATKQALEYYDIVLLACEGGENGNTKPTASLQFMHDWLGEGGKVFATHFHYYWFKSSPQTDFQNVATWKGTSVGAGVGNYVVDTSFVGGATFDKWLTAPGVAAATGTQIALTGVADSVSAVSTNANQWIYDGLPNFLGQVSNDPKYLSFLTPIGGMTVTTPTGDAGTDGGSGSS
ncbi:MAG: hypothetical protein ACRENE_09200, partial [Polyangiaceae bacterium]